MFRAPSLWSPINQILAVEQYGPPRFLGSPLAPLPCSKRPRPRLSCHASSAKRCCPRKTDHEGHSNSTISRLIHTASVLAVYASSFGFPYTGKTRFRWVANPYRVGFEPTGLRWRISSTIFTDYPNAPDFAWRHCPLSSFLSLLPTASCQLHFPCVLYLPLIVIKSSAKTHRGMTHGNTESQKLS